MNALISGFGQWADIWGESIWRASWQGAIALAVAWVIGRWCTFLSPRVVCWVWRLACLKLLIGLFAIQPVELALLPARPRQPPPQTISYDVARDWAETYPAAQQEAAQPAEPVPVSRLAAGLLLPLWLIGFFYCLRRTMRQRKSIHRLLTSSELCPAEPLTRILAEEARRLGVRRLPALRCSRETESPLLLGIWRPAIILPAGVEEKFDESERRVMIAHELAHLRRHDLAWNWLPAVAGWLFFFHPLVWLMTRRWSEAQEAACDELVIQRRAVQPADYGRLLVKLATLAPAETNLAPSAAGVLGAYRNLERRILAMARVRPFSPRRLAAAAAMLLVVAVVTIIPWQLVAKQSAAETPAADGSSADAQQEKRPDGHIVATDAVFVPGRVDETTALADPAANRALQRLRELGATPAGVTGDGGLTLGIHHGWKGTDEDLKLLADLPPLGSLVIEWGSVNPAALSRLKLARPVKVLALDRITGERLADLTHLPAADRLILPLCTVPAEGWSQLARLAEGVQSIDLLMSPSNDDALRAIGQVQSLESLQINGGTLSDDSLSYLKAAKRLSQLQLLSCEGIGSLGYAHLADVPSLRKLTLSWVPIDAAVLRVIARLTWLEELDVFFQDFPPQDMKPADLEVLANLRNLTALGFGSINPTEGMAAEFGGPICRLASQMPKLRRLMLRSIATDAGALEDLAKLPHLEELGLAQVAASDRVLASLAAIKSLKQLDLTIDGEVAQPQAARLAKLPLTRLVFVGSKLGDDGLAELTALSGLVDLVVQASNVTGSGLKTATNWKRLKMLNLEQSPFNDAGSEQLRNLPALEFLDLSDTKITDRALDAIAGLPNLRSLALDRNAVTIDGLLKLAALKNPLMLSLQGVKLSDDDWTRFKKALPNVAVLQPGFLAADSDDPAVVAATATSLGNQGRLNEAIEQLTKAHEKQASPAVLLAALQILRANLDQVSDAQKKMVEGWVAAAIAEDQNSLELKLVLVDLWDLEGRADDSIRLYRELLARKDVEGRRRAQMQNNLAFQLAARGEKEDLPEAESLIGAAIAEMGNLSSLLDTRANVRLAKGDFQAAATDFKAIIAQDPAAINYLHLALAEDKAGNETAAAEALANAEKHRLDVKSLSDGEQRGYQHLKEAAAKGRK